jgi:integrase
MNAGFTLTRPLWNEELPIDANGMVRGRNATRGLTSSQSGISLGLRPSELIGLRKRNVNDDSSLFDERGAPKGASSNTRTLREGKFAWITAR